MSLKFSQMDAAAALTGTESVPLVQDGQNRKATAQAIANLSAQVQSDWNVTDTGSKAFILNKPGLATNTTAGLMSAGDKVRLDTLPTTPVTSIGVTAPLTSTGGQTPTLGVLPAGNTSAGVIEIATDAEVTAGLANNLAVPPSGLKVELDKKANQATTYTKAEVDIEIGLVETQLADKAPLNGVGTTGTWPISVTGSAGSASILSAGRTFSVSGDATGTSGAFNGSANVVIPLALANSGVAAGTYNDNPLAVRPFTVDAKGRVTGIGAAVTITPAFSSITGKPTTLSGYGITDAAPLASPAFTGVPTAPTAALGTNTTQLATTAFVTAAVVGASGFSVAGAGLTASGSTLNVATANVGRIVVNADSIDLASGIATPGTFKSVTVDTYGRVTAGTNPTTLAGYGITDAAPLASPAFTGVPTGPTAVADTNTTQLATTAFVVGQGYLKSATAASTYAPLASPALTGVPTVPTAAVNTNTTQAASTAFVIAQIADDAPTKTGTGASGTWGISITGSSASTTGNAATATALSTARTLALTGDVTGSVSSDLSTGASITAAIAAGVIVDADVNAGAAIAGTKIAPDFGAQDVITTGVSTAARFVPTSSTVPTNGLYLPAANSVGIAVASAEQLRVTTTGLGLAVTPGQRLHINGVNISTGAVTDESRAQILLTNSSGTGGLGNIGNAIAFSGIGMSRRKAMIASVQTGSNANQIGIAIYSYAGTTTSTDIVTERFRVEHTNNVKIGGTADRATTAGTNQLVIFDGTAPVGTLTNGCSFYSTTGEMRVMDASGAATLLSPHDDDGYWIFDSTDTRNNRRLLVHMEKMAKWIDAQFGTNFVEEIGGPPVPV